jgi:hypothetical protein
MASAHDQRFEAPDLLLGLATVPIRSPLEYFIFYTHLQLPINQPHSTTVPIRSPLEYFIFCTHLQLPINQPHSTTVPIRSPLEYFIFRTHYYAHILS